MKHLIAGLIATVALIASPALARQAPPAPSQAGAAKPLTIDSKVGELIANPKTDAVLKAQIPEARNNEMFATAGADLSLREITQYETSITPEKLAAVAKDLAAVQSAP
jgi:predicted aminopeptidase